LFIGSGDNFPIQFAHVRRAEPSISSIFLNELAVVVIFVPFLHFRSTIFQHKSISIPLILNGMESSVECFEVVSLFQLFEAWSGLVNSLFLLVKFQVKKKKKNSVKFNSFMVAVFLLFKSDFK